MRRIILPAVLFLSLFRFSLAHTGELVINNQSTTEALYVRVVPIGAIFNGRYEYSLDCANGRLGVFGFIYGGDSLLPKFGGSVTQSQFDINFDYDNIYGTCNRAIGFGKYRVEFYSVEIQSGDTTIASSPFDYCDVDYSDFDYPFYPIIGGHSGNT